MIDVELALAAITLALLILLAALSAFSARIAKEKKELQRIRKKIDSAEVHRSKRSACKPVGDEKSYSGSV